MLRLQFILSSGLHVQRTLGLDRYIPFPYRITTIALNLILNVNPYPHPTIGFGVPAPWCNDCHQDWDTYGITESDPVCLVRRKLTCNQTQTLTLTCSSQARKLVGTRGETTLIERAISRLPGPRMGQEPKRNFAPGRRRIKTARSVARLAVTLEYAPCKKGNRCKHDCTYISAGDRHKLYQEYMKSRTEVHTLTLTQSQPSSLNFTLTLFVGGKRC